MFILAYAWIGFIVIAQLVVAAKTVALLRWLTPVDDLGGGLPNIIVTRPIPGEPRGGHGKLGTLAFDRGPAGGSSRKSYLNRTKFKPEFRE